MFLGQEYAFSFIVPFIFSQHKCFISAILNFINNMLYNGDVYLKCCFLLGEVWHQGPPT